MLIEEKERFKSDFRILSASFKTCCFSSFGVSDIQGEYTKTPNSISYAKTLLKLINASKKVIASGNRLTKWIEEDIDYMTRHTKRTLPNTTDINREQYILDISFAYSEEIIKSLSIEKWPVKIRLNHDLYPSYVGKSKTVLTIEDMNKLCTSISYIMFSTALNTLHNKTNKALETIRIIESDKITRVKISEYVEGLICIFENERKYGKI
jgi:hypothetical protein